MTSEGGSPPVRIYQACSVDGFISGPDDDLSWLPDPGEADGLTEAGALGFEEHLAEMGVILMGRRTWDVVASVVDPFGPDFPYGELPLLVATGRPLGDVPQTVRAASGSVGKLVEGARTVAGGSGVYLDGGRLAGAALREGLVDELVLTVVPVVLGDGTALFGGLAGRIGLDLAGAIDAGDGIVQLRYRISNPAGGFAGSTDGGPPNDWRQVTGR